MINKGYAFIDVETNGLDPVDDQITQFACIITDHKLNEVERINTFVKLWEGNDLPPKIIELTGITRELLNEKGITIFELKRLIQAKLHDKIIVAHNANFDLGFLSPFIRPDYFYCTKYLSWLMFGKDNSLDKASKRLGIKNDKPHDAMYDTETMYQIFKHYYKSFVGLPMYINHIKEFPGYKLVYEPQNAIIERQRGVKEVAPIMG